MRYWPLIAGLLLAACQLAVAEPKNLAELIEAQRLEIGSSISPATGLVPGQRARLSLKIATDRWFTGGTRIVVPEVPGLVILQTDQFASNASENRGGQSWVVQRWTLDIYPQRAGNFTIPPVTLKVSVNGGSSGNLEGEVTSPGVNFEVDLPEALVQSGAEQWVAAPDFTARQSFDRALEGLVPGDAFEREIAFSADEVMAMMLPSFQAQQQEGLAAYPRPPQLEDTSNRGQTSARRTERTSYVVEAEGDYLLPALEYFWWDTTAGVMRLISLDEVAFTVGAGTPVAEDEEAEDSLITAYSVAALLAVAVMLGLGLWLIYRWFPRAAVHRAAHWLRERWQQLQDMRKPALPQRLNPDSSVAD